MNQFKVFEKNTGTYIANQVRLADTLDTRVMGLMFKKELEGYDGLLLDPCNSIHTFFMKMEIDVLFLDRNNQVIKILRKMKPWRMTKIYFKSRRVLEMKAGSLPENIQEGQTLEIECLS